MNFWENKKVLVTGGTGFLGHHVVEALKNKSCKDIFISESKKYDLTKEKNVIRLFNDYHPDIVIHLAGLVGGILPNKERPAEYFYQNLTMGTFMFHYSWKNIVEKFVAAGAGCGYPENAPMPLKESSFWAGYPQDESAPYSLAKRLLSIQSMAYYRQYNFVSTICIPGNLYGPWDKFNLSDAHVIPALVRKFVEARNNNSEYVEVWGSGKPTRDFIYAGDVAQGILKAAETYDRSELVNISSGTETSIKKVCDYLKEITGFNGKIKWIRSRPDGQLRRCFDISKAQRELNFKADIDIYSGLKKTVEWYEKNSNNPRIRK